MFVRDGDSIQPSKHFPEGIGLEARTRKDALFLSVAAEFNGTIASALVGWFRSMIVRATPSSMMARSHTPVHAIESGRYSNAILALIRELDVGIDDIRIERELSTRENVFETARSRDPELAVEYLRPRVLTVHRSFTSDGAPGSDVLFDIARQESDGTKKLFALASFFVEALHQGRVLVFDELDAQLHPHLTQALVRLFCSPIANQGRGQILFTTHDTHLQDHRWLRRDQIWIADKNRLGATSLRSVADYRGVRNDSSFEAGYLHGNLGGVPHIGDPAGALLEVFRRSLESGDARGSDARGAAFDEPELTDF